MISQSLYTHACINMHMHAHTCTQAHACTHRDTRYYSVTHMHAHALPHMHTVPYTHTHTHTHMYCNRSTHMHMQREGASSLLLATVTASVRGVTELLTEAYACMRLKPIIAMIRTPASHTTHPRALRGNTPKVCCSFGKYIYIYLSLIHI